MNAYTYIPTEEIHKITYKLNLCIKDLRDGVEIIRYSKKQDTVVLEGCTMENPKDQHLKVIRSTIEGIKTIDQLHEFIKENNPKVRIEIA